MMSLIFRSKHVTSLPGRRDLIFISMALFFAASSGLVLPMRAGIQPVRAPGSASVRMECVDSISISKEIKSVSIFDGDYVRVLTCPQTL